MNNNAIIGASSIINSIVSAPPARLSELDQYANVVAYDCSVAANLNTDFAKTTRPNDRQPARVFDPVVGSVDMTFLGLETHTPIPGATISQPPYFNEFYKGVWQSNNGNQRYETGALTSISTLTLFLVYRIAASPPQEAFAAATGGIQIAADGNNYERLEIGVGGGEIHLTPDGTGYPDGLGNNGDTLELLVDIITKDGTSWNYYRYTSTTRATLDSWTTTANDSINKLNLGSNGHPQNILWRYIGLNNTVLSLSDMNAIAVAVNNDQPLGSLLPGMPQPKTTSLAYNDELEQITYTIEVANHTVPHTIDVQFFQAGSGGAPNLNVTAFATGTGAAQTYPNNVLSTINASVNHEDITDFNVNYIVGVTYDSVSNTFTVNSNQSGSETIGENEDVVLIVTAGAYPSGMSRIRYYIDNLVGTGLVAGNTFQLAQVSNGPTISFGDNGGTLSIIRRSLFHFDTGVKAERTSDAMESLEVKRENGSWVRNNID